MKLYHYQISIANHIARGRSSITIDLGCKPHPSWADSHLKNETMISVHGTNALAALHILERITFAGFRSRGRVDAGKPDN